MPLTSNGWRQLAAVFVVLFAALNTINALNKGGDAAVFFEGGRRFLAVEPLYEGSSAAAGFIGPPFQAMFFAPFAWIAQMSPVAAKLSWHILNVACLVAGIAFSAAAWRSVRGEWGPRSPPHFLLVAPLVAVFLPVQTNFEHQNMNPLLLAVLAGATWHLTLGSALIAGVLVGFATALKVFPGFIVLYLCLRRRWTAAAAAVATAGLLTILPLLFYGADAFQHQAAAFWRLANSGWPVRGNNQSLVAALDRFTSGFSIDGMRSATEAPLSYTLFVLTGILLIVSLSIVVLRTKSCQAPVPCEAAAVVVLAVLLSPIAWDHYWTLLFPAFLIVYDSADPQLLGRAGRYLFWIAAALTTMLSPVTLGRHGFNLARELSVNTAAGLILFGALLWLLRAREVGLGTSSR